MRGRVEGGEIRVEVVKRGVWAVRKRCLAVIFAQLRRDRFSLLSSTSDIWARGASGVPGRATDATGSHPREGVLNSTRSHRR